MNRFLISLSTVSSSRRKISVTIRCEKNYLKKINKRLLYSLEKHQKHNLQDNSVDF